MILRSRTTIGCAVAAALLATGIGATTLMGSDDAARCSGGVSVLDDGAHVCVDKYLYKGKPITSAQADALIRSKPNMAATNGGPNPDTTKLFDSMEELDAWLVQHGVPVVRLPSGDS